VVYQNHEYEKNSSEFFDGDIIPGMNRRVVFVIRYSLHFQRTGFFHDPNGFVVDGMISRALARASV
jgi:hypothetical protein